MPAPARSITASPHLPNVKAVGVDMHIGSQITDLEPFGNAFALMAELVTTLRADGHAIEHVDVGGGLGIPYDDDRRRRPHPEAYAAVVRDKVGQLGLQAGDRARPPASRQCRHHGHQGRICEGRRHQFRHRRRGDERFDPPHALRGPSRCRPPVNHSNLAPITADIVGPVCETGDYLAKARTMPGVKEGDLLAVMSAGAYGAVMASTYNSRPLIPEVLVDGDKFHVIRPRKSLEQLLALDSVPDWL